MKKFYLYNGVGAQQEGPFDIEDLKSKNITRETPVWYEGMPDWTTAGNLEELKSILATIPPPFKAEITPTPEIQKSTTQQKNLTSITKSRSSIGRKVLILVGIVVLALIGVLVYNQIQSQEIQKQRINDINTEEDTKARIRKNITSYVIVERNEYTYNTLGGISNLKIKVTNNTDYIIDNVKVKIVYIKTNGQIWDSRIIDFNLLEPQTKSTI